MTGVIKRGNLDTDTHTHTHTHTHRGRMPCEDKGRVWSVAEEAKDASEHQQVTRS
jgi:hypothetical protein